MFTELSHAPEHLYLVDILRGLGAAAIVVFHYKNFARGQGVAVPDHDRLMTNPLLEALPLLTQHGSLAVMLFWMISGFVMVLVYGSVHSDRGAATYMVNRVARLYPLHLVTLLAMALMQALSNALLGGPQIYHDNDLPHFLSQLFFVSGLVHPDTLSFNGPIWSVSAEMAAYAVFFAFIRVIPVSPGSLLGMTLLAMAGYLLVPHVALLCLVFFFAGGTCYALRALLRQHGMRVQAGASLLALAAFLAQAALLPAYAAHVPLTFTLLGLFGALILAASGLDRGRVRRAILPFRGIGDITYSSYLLHTPIQVALLIAAGLGLFDPDLLLRPGTALTYFAVVALASYWCFLRFELPAKTWTRRRLLGASSRRSVA